MVSAHLGARPEHHKWQGKFYSRSGRDKRFPDFVASTGYGTVTGLCGANCRHSFGPGDGVNNPYDTYDSEENQKAYDLQQRQRLLERRIRKTKRQVMGLKATADEAATPELKAGFTLDYEKKSVLLSKQNAAYKQFCKENNLKELSDRLAIAKWDRKQAAAARGAYRTVANKANKLYNGSAEENLNHYLHHIKEHALMEKNGIVFKRWINDKEAVVNAGKRRISSERVHAVENRALKADRAEMTIDVAQAFIDNSKLVLYQTENLCLKYLSDNGYAVINFDNQLVTAVPQKWRRKYDKYLEELDEKAK